MGSMSTDAEPWPEKAELERWLMNTVKDPDPGALFLRQVLQMNPAYGGYMQSDKDLVQIVQLYAKRLRARMVSSSGPMSPSSFYEPLCEMTWRITGHVLHAVLILDDTAPNSLPVPKEPLGQVKMLVQTNMELSKKLNMMRRDYLRELTSHRDKQRTISDEAHGVLDDLQENPVMFFEPLKFVLDDVTKEFIKLVVEERVKLEQKGPPIRRVDTKRLDELESNVGKTSEREKALQSELDKAYNELERVQEKLKDSEVQVKRLEAAEKSVREQLERAEEHRSNAARQAMQQNKSQEDQLRHLRQQLEEQERAMKQLQSSMGSSEEKKMEALTQRTKELSEAKAQLAELTLQLAKLKEELNGSQQQLKEAEEKRLAAEQRAEAEAAKAKVPPKVETPTDDSAELRRELEEASEIVTTLRKEKSQLQKALKEAEASNADLQQQLKVAKKQEASPKPQVKEEEPKPPPKVEVDEEQTKTEEKKLEVVAPRVIEVVQPAKTEDLEIWKEKCANLEDEKVDLENQISDLNQQVRILTEKLQEVGGEQALLEVQEKIKLTVKPRQKKKKKRAYERLWQDAQRRIINMRVQAKVLEKEQQDQIVAWRKNAVTNSNSMKIIENLSRMHYDASSSQTALNQAMEDYSIENQDGDMHDVWDDEEDEADDTPLSHPGTSAKYNFSGIEEAMGSADLEEQVEILKNELLQRQQELRSLRSEVAMLRRTQEMSDGGSEAATPSAASFGTSRASIKPFMALNEDGELVYVRPQERPLPKGERYDPSQDNSNYLQQLQQMQQANKDAPQRPSIAKFKRAVDLIRKSKPDVRASLVPSNEPRMSSRPMSAADKKISSSLSVAALGAEISASTAMSAPSGTQSAPLSRQRQSVKKAQGSLSEILSSNDPEVQPTEVVPSESREQASLSQSRPTTAGSQDTTQFPVTLPQGSETTKPPSARHPPSPRQEATAGHSLADRDSGRPTTASTAERPQSEHLRTESRNTSVVSSSGMPQDLQSFMALELPELVEQASREGSKNQEAATPPGEFGSREPSKKEQPEPSELEKPMENVEVENGEVTRQTTTMENAATSMVDTTVAAPIEVIEVTTPEVDSGMELKAATLGASREPSKNTIPSPGVASQEASREPSKNTIPSPGVASQEASREPSKNTIPSPGVASQEAPREPSKNTIPSPGVASQEAPREPSKNTIPSPGVASQEASREPSKNTIPSPGVASQAATKNVTISSNVASQGPSRETSKNTNPSPGASRGPSRQASKNSLGPTTQFASRPSSKGPTSMQGPPSREGSKTRKTSSVTQSQNAPAITQVTSPEMLVTETRSQETPAQTNGPTSINIEAASAPDLATVLSYKPDLSAVPKQRGRSPAGSKSPQRSRTSSPARRSDEGREAADAQETNPPGGIAEGLLVMSFPSDESDQNRPASVPSKCGGLGSFSSMRQVSAPDGRRSSPNASKEAPMGHAHTDVQPPPRRLQGRPFASRCKTSPSLPTIQVPGDFGGGHRLAPGEGTPTSRFPVRTRRSRDRFGSDEWDPAPVKPRTKGLMVTAMRSQEWMSQVTSDPADE